MAHRDRVGGSSGRRKVAGDAGHRQNFSTPSDGPHGRSLWVIITAPWYNMPLRHLAASNSMLYALATPMIAASVTVVSGGAR